MGTRGPWCPPRPPPVLVTLGGCGVPGRSWGHGDIGAQGQHGQAMQGMCSTERGDLGSWRGGREGMKAAGVRGQELGTRMRCRRTGFGDRDTLQWGWRIGDRDAQRWPKELGSGMLSSRRQRQGPGCSALGAGPGDWDAPEVAEAPWGLLSPLGAPKLGPLCTHVLPIPCWGCSGQCPALPRGTARPLPVLSTPPLPEPAWQHLPAGPKRSPRPRAAPFTGPKPGSPLPVNPCRPRAGNCGHVLCRVCDLGAAAKPRGDTEGARGWVPVPPPYCWGRPRRDGAVAHPARGSVPARRWLPSR